MEKLVTINDTARAHALQKSDFNKRFNFFAIKILRAAARSQTVECLRLWATPVSVHRDQWHGTES
jgi:hypothetical protein